MRIPSCFTLVVAALAFAACGKDAGTSGGYGASSGGAGDAAGTTQASGAGAGSGKSCGGGGSGYGGGTAPAAPAPVAAVKVVEIRNMAFVPATLTVKVGESVRWVNRDRMPHSATRDAGEPRFDTGSLSHAEESQPVTFSTESGTAGFAYVCSFHGSMRGTVIVTK